jgi:hypothetical protein
VRLSTDRPFTWPRPPIVWDRALTVSA